MRAIDVYLMYCALKAHFKGDYDYHKFSGQTKVKRDSFWKRKDRIFFVKVGRKYDDDELLNYFVSNFIQERNGYIANFMELITSGGGGDSQLATRYPGHIGEISLNPFRRV